MAASLLMWLWSLRDSNIQPQPYLGGGCMNTGLAGAAWASLEGSIIDLPPAHQNRCLGHVGPLTTVTDPWEVG